MTIRVGVSGWSYRHWRGGRFYPQGLRQSEELAYAASHFDALEANRPFYSLLTPPAYRGWVAATPPGTVIAVKGSRYITHMKRLGDATVPLANFFASGLLALGERLGPVLWQLPAAFRWDARRVDGFLSELPSTIGEAAALAARHDQRVADPLLIADVPDEEPIRYALEPRHPSFFTAEAEAVLAEHEVALAVSHSSRWPWHDAVLTDLMYVRLHGPRQLYASAYRDDELEEWAQRCLRWSAAGCAVYVFFDNDERAIAPHQAAVFRDLVAARRR